jgi:hypothetical protein
MKSVFHHTENITLASSLVESQSMFSISDQKIDQNA